FRVEMTIENPASLSVLRPGGREMNRERDEHAENEYGTAGQQGSPQHEPALTGRFLSANDHQSFGGETSAKVRRGALIREPGWKLVSQTTGSGPRATGSLDPPLEDNVER